MGKAEASEREKIDESSPLVASRRMRGREERKKGKQTILAIVSSSEADLIDLFSSSIIYVS